MLSKTTTPQELSNLLGTSYSKLAFVIYGSAISGYYETFTIPKKNGELRTIRAPNPQLKILQRRLKTLLEDLYTPHNAASAFIKGRGIVYNAQFHVKKQLVLNLDLSDFFDQINFGRVFGLLKSKPYCLSKDTARIIAHICCVDGKIPQGAPTSPVLSNMICKSLDKQLSNLAAANNAFYTRYADDITFSFNSISRNDIYRFSASPTLLAQNLFLKLASFFGKKTFKRNKVPLLKKPLISVIQKNGFQINPVKTRIQARNQTQIVTGLKVNTKVNIDRRYIRTTRAMLHSMDEGKEIANAKYMAKFPDSEKSIESTVQGRISYIGMVKGRDSSVYIKLAEKFNNAYPLNKLSMMPNMQNGDIEDELKFRHFRQQERLNQSVWVVSFEGIEGDDIDELVCGTAFMIAGQRLITASHIFSKAKGADECFVYKINETHNKYRAIIRSDNKQTDVAELKFVDDDLPTFPHFSVAPDLAINSGYMLSVVGFPELLPGHNSVAIMPCTLLRNFSISKIKHGEVDGLIRAGNSGGPVLNAFMQVVGMVRTGYTIQIDEDTGNIGMEGSNLFVYADHFPELQE